MERIKNTYRVAVLDMYDGAPNQGLQSILNILEDYRFCIKFNVYNVRQKNEIPDLSYDIYISTGGPGSPLLTAAPWEKNWHQLIDKLWHHNQRQELKKHVFFICHSFQMACQHFGLGELTARRSTSFGIFPVHKTQEGIHDPLFETLHDPFWAVDSRDWQVIQPDLRSFDKFGAQLLALEKIRDHVDYERAIMAVRFSDEFFGTQFHPEANAAGMITYMKQAEKRTQIITNHGLAKYEDMMLHLRDPDKITLTHNTIIPRFLEMAMYSMQEA
ncbi:MAG: type 1 glutamine amidotransferase [Bacteroidia bacterium]